MTALARTSRNCKGQTRRLVRENAPHKKKPQLSDSNKNLAVSTRWVFIPRETGRLIVSRNVRLDSKKKPLNDMLVIAQQKQKKNSVALVRKRAIPTERPPLVGEVTANFCGQRVSRGQRKGSPRPYSRFYMDRSR
jgi:hypothetical protein